MFQLRLFGSPTLEVDDVALTGPAVQRHRLAMLALLALAPGRRMSRDKLIAFLWPERDTEKGRNLLKQATYVLRAQLSEDAVLSEGDELRLNDQVISTDAGEFDVAINQRDFPSAIRLYRGPFMDGFFVSESPELEAWIAQERQRLANAYGGALEHMVAAAEASGDWTAAVEWWKKRAAQDPLDTRVALSLMHALNAAGSRGSALQHAAIHERLLQDELGLSAPAELTAAVEQLREQPAVVAASSQPQSSQSAEPTREAPAPPRSTPRRRLRVPIVAAAVVLVSAAALGTLILRPDQNRKPAIDTATTTQNREAYKLYLRGRYFWNKRTEKDIERALEYYGQAVDMDPGYALAWAGIADAWIFRGWYAQYAPREAFPKAKTAALRALEFDSALAAAHASLAHVYFRFEHNWPAAEREYRLAIQLEPNNSVAHHWYGGFLSVMGRNAEAFAQADTAVSLDPLAPIIQTWQGLHHYFARQYDAAIVEYRKAIRLSDDFAPAHWHLSWALLELKRYPEAVAEAKRASSIDPGNLLYQAAVGYADARAGMKDEARALLASLMKTAKSEYVSAYDVALIHIALGENREGLDWLERAYAERAVMIPYLRVDPRLDPVRRDARFQRLLRAVRLDF